MARKYSISLHGDISGWLGEHPVPSEGLALDLARALARDAAVRLGEPVEAWCHIGTDGALGATIFRTRHVPGVTLG